MAKDREARYPTCSAFVEDLRSALGGGAVSARPIRPASRRRTPLLVAAVAGLGLVAVAGLALASGVSGIRDRRRLAVGIGGRGGALVAPSPTGSPTPDPSVFPNTAEAALLDPAAGRPRGDVRARRRQSGHDASGWNGQIVTSRSGAAPNIVVNREPVQPKLAPKASLVCSPPNGPDAVYFQELREDLQYSDSGEEAGIAVAKLGTRYAIETGDCSSGGKAVTTWSVGGSAIPSGTVVCIPKAGWDDASWLYWSFGNGNTLWLRHAQGRGLRRALPWWKNLTLFIE